MRRRLFLGLAALAAGCRRAEAEAPAPSAAPAPAPPAPSASTAKSAELPEDDEARARRLIASREKLLPLHERVGKPLDGDWRAEHPDDHGESFEEYRAGKPTVPEGARRVLAIQPLGDFDETQGRIVTIAAACMRAHFGLATRVLPRASLADVPASARRKHPSWGDEQILTTYLLSSLAKGLPADAAALLAFTTHDLWPGAGWNFVFGQAEFRDRVGVWSIHRFGDPKASPEAFRLALLRAMRTAVHETGHMFSLEHCTQYRCVQAGVNNLDEDDRSPLWLCPDCLIKVAWATRTSPKERLREMGAFCTEQGLAREATFFARSVAALRA